MNQNITGFEFCSIAGIVISPRESKVHCTSKMFLVDGGTLCLRCIEILYYLETHIGMHIIGSKTFNELAN